MEGTLFYVNMRDDHRIGPVHISLFIALVTEAGLLIDYSFVVRRDALMRFAKIQSRVTYNRCMRELHAYGYIVYRPSYVAGQSMVKLVMVES